MTTKLDLHTHTKGSGAGQDDGSSTAEEILKHVLEHTAIDGLVVTGHHRTFTPEAVRIVEGLRRAGRTAFFGAEYSSDDGHVLVFGCDVQALGLGRYSPMEVVAARAAAMGGIAIPSHPHADRARKSIRGRFHKYERVLTAIEGANGGHQRSGSQYRDREAQAEARALGWGLTGGSDGHHASHIGCVWTEFADKIRTEFDLVRALRAGAMRPVIDEIRIAELKRSGASYYGGAASWREEWKAKAKKSWGSSKGRSKRAPEPELDEELEPDLEAQLQMSLDLGDGRERRCRACGSSYSGSLQCPSCYNVAGADRDEDEAGEGEEGIEEVERIRASLDKLVRGSGRIR